MHAHPLAGRASRLRSVHKRNCCTHASADALSRRAARQARRAERSADHANILHKAALRQQAAQAGGTGAGHKAKLRAVQDLLGASRPCAPHQRVRVRLTRRVLRPQRSATSACTRCSRSC